jgi:hypothetical protein
MSIRLSISAAALGAAFALSLVGGAQAQSVRQECSTKYQSAKTAGTLAGQTWNQFYSKCSADAKAAPAAAAPAAAPAAAAPAANPLKPAAAAPAAKPAAPAAAAPAAAGSAVFRPRFRRNTPTRAPASSACTPASISIRPTRPATAMAA